MISLWKNYSFIFLFIILSTIMGLMIIYNLVDEDYSANQYSIEQINDMNETEGKKYASQNSLKER